MRRREFITLLGAAAWPLAAQAQQPSKLLIIGFLGTSTPLAMSQWVAAFVQRLRELGWIEGRTVAIEYRWAEGRTVNEIVKGESAARLVYPRAWPRAVSCRRNLPPAQNVILSTKAAARSTRTR